MTPITEVTAAPLDSSRAPAGAATPGSTTQGTRSAVKASIGWTLAGFAFAPVMLLIFGGADAGHYLSVFVLEKTLSLDNVAMFAAILGAAQLTPALTGKVLSGGLIGALVLRIAFIAAGLAVVDAVHSVMLVFAAVLLYSGYKMARPTASHTKPNGTTPSSGMRFTPAVFRDRPVVAALLAIVVVDVAFAVDSIIAAFAITTSAAPIIAANVFAVLGLRPLYVVLSDAIERFRYLRPGIGLLLVAIGAELVIEHFVPVPSWVTLVAVGACLAGSIGASLMVDRKVT